MDQLAAAWMKGSISGALMLISLGSSFCISHFATPPFLSFSLLHNIRELPSGFGWRVDFLHDLGHGSFMATGIFDRFLHISLFLFGRELSRSFSFLKKYAF